MIPDRSLYPPGPEWDRHLALRAAVVDVPPPASDAGPRDRTADRPRRRVPPGRRPRVGFWTAIASAVGGTETWHDMLLPRLDRSRLDVMGLAIAGPADPAMATRLLGHAGGGIGHGAARDLAARCDVIVYWGIGDPGSLLPPGPDRPTMVCVSHGDGSGDWTRGWISQAEAAGLVDHAVAVSGSAVGPYPPSRQDAVVVLPNGIDPARIVAREPRSAVRARWGLPDGVRVMGYLGRFSAEKDPHALLRAIPHLPPEWHAVFVGSGHHEAVLRAEAARLAPGRSHFPGATADVGSALAAFDVLVVPSREDGFCLVMVEGWMAGVPVIATPVGVVPDHPGLVRPIPRDPGGPALAAAVLADAADRATPTRALVARDVALRTMTADAFAARWSEFLMSIVPRRNAKPRVPLGRPHPKSGDG